MGLSAGLSIKGSLALETHPCRHELDWVDGLSACKLGPPEWLKALEEVGLLLQVETDPRIGFGEGGFGGPLLVQGFAPLGPGDSGVRRLLVSPHVAQDAAGASLEALFVRYGTGAQGALPPHRSCRILFDKGGKLSAVESRGGLALAVCPELALSGSLHGLRRGQSLQQTKPPLHCSRSLGLPAGRLSRPRPSFARSLMSSESWTISSLREVSKSTRSSA